MTDKVAKLLAKVSKKDLIKINSALKKINALDFEGLDIKTFKGQSNVYRVRVGNYRIIFRVDIKNVLILKVDRRSEDTYREF
jgi:mRNA-degrading endonuclease RelE of RelBE toxin-antitoxin system